MEYLVEMTLAALPKTPEEGIILMEIYILPTLALAKKLKQENKIISGGLMVGIWSRMQTTVIPLTSFESREIIVKQLLETTKKRIAEAKTQQQNQ